MLRELLSTTHTIVQVEKSVCCALAGIHHFCKTSPASLSESTTNHYLSRPVSSLNRAHCCVRIPFSVARSFAAAIHHLQTQQSVSN